MSRILSRMLFEFLETQQVRQDWPQKKMTKATAFELD